VAALFLFLILLAVGPTAGNRQLLGVVILAATTAVAIEALRRQTLREFPEDPPSVVGKVPGAT
jgi:DNA-binding transcriptional regulator YdaS (Cro superfamily)